MTRFDDHLRALRPAALLALGIAGVALIVLPAHRYRIDQVHCAEWPALSTGLLYGAGYLLGVALLTISWLGMWAGGGRFLLRTALLLALPLHLVALLGQPFLSDDPLCYAAIGRLMAHFHGDPYQPLRDSLPAADPFLRILPELWQKRGSAYFAGFNGLAWAIARAGGDDLALHLRLYQCVGLCVSLLSAAVAGLAARAASADDRGAGPRAALAVAFCPLTVIEGILNPHNDVFLLFTTALFALCVAKGRRALAVGALFLGVLIKASALLLLFFYGAYLFFTFARKLSRAQARWGFAILAALGIGALAVVIPRVGRFTLLFGSPADPYDYCTRSIECLPRVLLRWVLGQPALAWGVGLLFRAAGGLFLLYAALRGSRDQTPLRWAATGIGLYYLYLHGWSQSWYWLSLVPLLPFADPRMLPTMRVLCVSAVAYYALVMPFACVTGNLPIALADLAEGLIVVAPPTVFLFRARAAR